MSGGVDSSVAAHLLKERGYDVVGVFMRCFNIDGCAERDAEDARRVAEKLDIPFYVWDFEEEYKRKVVDYMIEGYRRGETPNPDVMCNREIKFGLFLNRALEMGADYVATGHYVILRQLTPQGTAVRALQRRAPAAARHSQSFGLQAANVSASFPLGQSTAYFLSAAKDKNKDQSYFLWTLTQTQLAHCLFPIGDYLKPEVREIARKAGLPTADKKDSQGICFLGQVTIADFLAEYLPEKKGEILTVAGKKVGEHKGAHFYTIGQRRGFGGGGGTPYYVAEKDMKTNTLVVAPSATDESLYRKEIELTDVNFIRSIESGGELRVLARVRYRQPVSAATLIDKKLVFDKPQKFVAAGQSAVFYTEDGEMLGGGVIK